MDLIKKSLKVTHSVCLLKSDGRRFVLSNVLEYKVSITALIFVCLESPHIESIDNKNVENTCVSIYI